MFEFFSDPNFKIIVTFIVMIFTFVSFVMERVPAHITAMGTMALLLALGVIDTNDALSAFSSPAAITIACMFIISAALQKTGVINLVGHYVLILTKKNKFLGIVALFAGIIITSAFMNNTPVVIIMTPIVILLAQKLKHYPSKYLIPLSYTAILGGTCTLIGTSTNILVDAVAQDYGKQAFSMFEITLPGIMVSVGGVLFMILFGRKLLPNYDLLESEFSSKQDHKSFIAEAVILKDSTLVGKTLAELENNADYEVIDLISGGGKSGYVNLVRLKMLEKLFSKMTDKAKLNKAASLDTVLKAGDKLILRTNREDLIDIKENFNLSFNIDNFRKTEIVNSSESKICEGVIGVNSRFIDKKPSDLKLRSNHGCYIVAIHRDEKNIISDFDKITLKYGDVLLIEGPKDRVEELFDDEAITNVTKFDENKFDPKKAPIAILTLAGVVGLAAFNVMPIAGLAIIGAVFIVLTGCVDMKKVHRTIEWPILMLIFGMLSLSTAMSKTGGAALIIDYIASLVGQHGPVVLLITIYLITSFFTEIMSNNATAVLIAPIAIGLADSMGFDSRPFIVAVMFAASASFATPIGYQTNTYVYNIGNYRFRDFLKVGIPMNLTIMVIAISTILLIWDF